MLDSLVRHSRPGHGGADCPVLLHLAKEHPHQGHPPCYLCTAVSLVHPSNAQATQVSPDIGPILMTYVLFQSQKPTQLEHGWKGTPGRDEQAGRVQGVQHALADSANETQHLTLTKSHCGTYFIRYLI